MARLPRISGAALAMCALLLRPTCAFAADAEPTAAQVSYSDGTVVLRSVGGNVAAAATNTALHAGDELTTRRGSLCEVQIDATTMFRVDARTRAIFTDLSSGRRELSLDRGDVEMRVFRLPADARVRTPSITVVAQEPGAYRISVGDDGVTDVVVRSGRAAVPLPASGELTLLPGTTLVANGSAANPTITYRATLAADDFDRWNDERDSLAGIAPVSAISELGPPLGIGTMGPGGLGLAALSDYGPSSLWLGSSGPPWLDSPASPWFGGATPVWLGGWGPMLVGATPFFSSNAWGFSPFGASVAWTPLVPVEIYAPYIAIGGRLYNRPNWNRANFPTSVRYVQRTRIAAPVHFTPRVRMYAPVQTPTRAVAPRPVMRAAPPARFAPSRAIAVPSARR
jgi:ferric-dicitrate binding protein FerR (iron transport regulator)